MNKGKMKWGLLALAVTLGVGLLALPPVPQQKMRAQRLHSVNRVASVSISMPLTNAQPLRFDLQ